VKQNTVGSTEMNVILWDQISDPAILHYSP